METVKLCHSCGRPIGSDAPGPLPGLPHEAGLIETGPETAGATPGFQPPAASELYYFPMDIGDGFNLRREVASTLEQDSEV